jgi:hypothetical protein
MVAGSFTHYACTLVGGFKIGGTSLQEDLALITDSGFLSTFPEELFTGVIEESREEHGRKVIMTHVHQCLRDVAKPRAWKRLHAAMSLIEELLTRGSPALLAETAVGLHFDVVQKLSFLEHFQHTSNQRAQNMVQSKAKVVKSSLVKRLQAFAAKTGGGKNTDDDNETDSTCSPKGSVAGSTCSFDSAATPPSLEDKPMFDFENLLEWAETDCEDDNCDFWFE